MADDHKRGRSGEHGGFSDAAKDAVRKYEAWCKHNNKPIKPDCEVEFRVGIDPNSSLSEYIVVLKVDD